MADQPQSAGVTGGPLEHHVSPARMAVLYRYTSLLWMVASASLGGYAYGSALLAHATVLRMVVPVLAAVVFLAMTLRLVTPGRPQWTRWTLPLMGGLSVCVFILALFGVESLGFTPVRLGAAGLTLSPALVAYLHWIGERMVGPR